MPPLRISLLLGCLLVPAWAGSSLARPTPVSILFHAGMTSTATTAEFRRDHDGMVPGNGFRGGIALEWPLGASGEMQVGFAYEERGRTSPWEVAWNAQGSPNASRDEVTTLRVRSVTVPFVFKYMIGGRRMRPFLGFGPELEVPISETVREGFSARAREYVLPPLPIGYRLVAGISRTTGTSTFFLEAGYSRRFHSWEQERHLPVLVPYLSAGAAGLREYPVLRLADPGDRFTLSIGFGPRVGVGRPAR